ncbi:Bromodomain-containing factor 1 [Hondaea fermentalgiana]|uniref:Bromodomain-containing factor 1 n=1 Tax=Hondaea fermentalgiana TaxID=2315210 RepID=A0A2R5GAG9_9STRA|nr:Bromodomain-containing factor 1 [Hondaea fermentalgiana]|eukprot:GBG27595.1 Bromodomain-containing factor 1 [Hondaea fermentalgiana]
MASENAMMNSADAGPDTASARKAAAVMGPDDAALSVNPQTTTAGAAAPDTLSASTPPKPAILRPALRGVLKRTGDIVKWEGQWGMDDNAFNGGIVSDFSYVRDHVHDSQDTNDVAKALSQSEDADLVSNAIFSGHFFMVLNGKKKKVPEKNVLFEFMHDESLPAGTVKVVGSGTNQYGKYSLEGSLVLATGALNVYREYKYEQPSADIRRVAGRRTSAPKPAAARRPVQRKPSRASLDSAVSGPDPVSSLAKNPPRMRRAPSHLVDDSFDDRTQQDLIKIKGIVRDLMRSDKEGWFHAPVDAEAMGLTTYHDIIKEPMDLGTIMKNLDARMYMSYQEVVRHVRLTFNNSMTFNPPANGVHQSAKRLLNLFENQLQKLERSRSRKRKSTAASSNNGPAAPSGPGAKGSLKRSKSEESSANGGSVAGPGRRTMSDLFSSDEEDNDEDDMSDDGDITAGVTSAPAKKRSKGGSRRAPEPAAAPAAAVPVAPAPVAAAPQEVVSDEVQFLREQVQKMEQQLKQIRDTQANGQTTSHAISGPPAPAPMPVMEAPRPARRDRSPNDVRRLSYQEMSQLGQDINKLPGDMIQGVIRIIQESGQPLGEDGDEVELDIEALDPPALKKLQKYVKRCLTKARKKQGRDEIDGF